MEKTFEQCCEKVAKKTIHEDYYTFEDMYLSDAAIEIIKEAANLYCQSQKAKAWEEGAAAQYEAMKAGADAYLNSPINPYKP